MDTIIHLNLNSLSQDFVQDLKEQFGSANIELHVQNPPSDWMTERHFWDLIAQLDWSKTGDDAAVVEPLVSALVNMPLANIYQFEDILSEKLWQLDTQDHALASKSGDEGAYLSADGFLYDRCCVVANGKDFFDEVMEDPNKFPVGYAFEPLLSIGNKAYLRKTGKEFQHVPRYNYETMSNTEGWKNQ